MTPAEQSYFEEPTSKNPTDLSAGNFKYTSRDFARGGLKAKFQANLAAIKTLKAIQLEGREVATPGEQVILSRFVGWGQFPALFNDYRGKWDEQQKRRELQRAIDPEFDESKWKNEQEALKSILTDDEWKAARRSTQNSHYTHPDVVDTHWKIAKRLGFKGGKFLETSAGIGYYLGLMPPELAGRTAAAAVELDPSVGGMLKLLYPGSHVEVKGFEKYAAPDDFYDLVASNVPFGGYKVNDPRYNKHKANIHDYFFLKSLDLAKPGGIVMHVTSSGTLDKQDSVIRKALAEKCEMVGAVRFPGGAHKENAGTEVVTDMVILRKKRPGEEAAHATETPKEAEPKKPGFTGTTVDSLGRLYHWRDGKRVPGPDWTDTTTVPDPAGGEPIRVNRYFAEHPEMVLGTLDRTGSMYRGDSVNVSKTEDYDDRLAAAIAQLPKDVYRRGPARKPFEPMRMPAPDEVREGELTIQDGKVFQREGGALVEQQTPAKDVPRIEGMLKIRAAFRKTVNDQLEGSGADESREELNKAYDAYVEEFGFLNAQANRRAMDDDLVNAPVLLALEKWDAKAKKADKADAFRKDTVRPSRHIEHVDTVDEAVGVSLHEIGRLDVDHMAKLTGASVQEVEAHLSKSGVAYRDPSTGWEPAAHYLSGNVRQKLVEARAAVELDPSYQRNVDALMKAQPEDIPHTRIGVRLGASWVPARDVKAFAAQLIGVRPDQDVFEVGYNTIKAEWTFRQSGGGGRQEEAWSTPRVKFKDLVDQALNNQMPTVYDTDSEGKRYVNVQATEDAKAKLQDIKDAFADWIWEDDERRDRLHRFYNDNFNNIVPLKYDGSHQTFPGMNPAINLYQHQKDFVWRVVTTGTGMAAHEVGTGKSFSMIASAMELRRLGLAKKPAIICLKANVEAITNEARLLYPGAKIISAVDIFDAKSRKKTVSQIAAGDWDMVVMTHDNLEMLQMKPEVQARFIEEEIAEIEAAMIAAFDEDPSKNNRIVKQLEKMKENLTAKLEKALSPEGKDSAVYFEETGIDQLFVDECFTEDTEVLTDRGPMKIGDIVNKKLSVSVLSCNRDEHTLEWRPVVSWFKKPVRGNLVEVFHEQGSFICTPNHNIWTEEEGYVPAGLLQSRHTVRCVPEGIPNQLGASAKEQNEVLQPQMLGRWSVQTGHKAVPVLREDIHQASEKWRRAQQVLLEVLRPEMVLVGPGQEREGGAENPRGRHGRGEACVFRENAIEQPDTRSRSQEKNQRSQSGPNVFESRWERPIDRAAKVTCDGALLANGTRNRDKGREAFVSLFAKQLQGGHRESGTDGCYRDRWQFAQQPARQISRQEKDGSVVGARVVRVEVYQQTGHDRTVDGRPCHFFVYDIEVEGTHNYFANGVNVSNCHVFKNLGIHTAMQRLNGVPTARSDRATDMAMRARWLQEQNKGRGFVTATGTPISNTMAELYVMQKFMQPNELKARGVQEFDAWASTFGDIQTKAEFDVVGELKPTSRFSKYVNMPVLHHMASQFMDIQRADDLRKPDGTPAIKRPKRKDEVVSAKPTQALAAFMANVVDRANAVRRKAVDPKRDNMLKICTDGRKAAVDMRLVDHRAEDDPHSKANQMVQNVLKLNREHKGAKAQLIFSNVGVNPAANGFHLYHDIIDKLVKGGIPRDKIADFTKLDGAKKEDAMEGLRTGRVLVGIGSTEKLGTGVNVQNKLAALHNLDAPWKPAEIEQRDGRGWRQGNENKSLGIYRYVTEKSLDQMFWQVLDTKAGFISQFMKGKLEADEIVEDDDEELSYAQIMAAATGDPRVLEKVNLDNEVRSMRRASDAHAREQQRFRDSVKRSEGEVLTMTKRAESLKNWVKHNAGQPEGFTAEIGGETFTNRKDAEAAFTKKNDATTPQSWETPRIATVRGNDVVKRGSQLFLVSPDGEEVGVGDSIQSVESIVRNLPKHAEAAEQDIKRLKEGVEVLKGKIGGEYPKAAELKAKQEKAKKLEDAIKKDSKKSGHEVVMDDAGAPIGTPDTEYKAPEEVRAGVHAILDVEKFGKKIPDATGTVTTDVGGTKQVHTGVRVGPFVVAKAVSGGYAVYHQKTGLRAFSTGKKDVAKAAAYISSLKGNWDFTEGDKIDKEAQQHGGKVSRAVANGDMEELAKIARETSAPTGTPAPAPEPASARTFPAGDTPTMEELRDIRNAASAPTGTPAPTVDDEEAFLENDPGYVAARKKRRDFANADTPPNMDPYKTHFESAERAAKEAFRNMQQNAPAERYPDVAKVEERLAKIGGKYGEYEAAYETAMNDPGRLKRLDAEVKALQDRRRVLVASQAKSTDISHIPVKTVSTSKGARSVHGFTPNESFWRVFKSAAKPPFVTTRKFGGKWHASVWGADDAEVRDNVKKLLALGIELPHTAKFQSWNFRDVLRYYREAPSRDGAVAVLRYCHDSPARYEQLGDRDFANVEYDVAEEDQDHGKVLAGLYSELWNDMSEAGMEPSESGLQAAADELSDHDWVVYWDDDEMSWKPCRADQAPHVVKYAMRGEGKLYVYKCPYCGGFAYKGSPVAGGMFNAAAQCSRCGRTFSILNRAPARITDNPVERVESAWEPTPSLFAQGAQGCQSARPRGGVVRYAAFRVPAGKQVTLADGRVVKGGKWISEADLARASPSEKKKVATRDDKAKERRLRGPVDTNKVRRDLAPHGHHELKPHEMKTAKSSFNALVRHHGDLVAHRLEELANGLHAALAKTPERQKRVREAFGRKLRAIDHMLGWAEAKRGEAKKPLSNKEKEGYSDALWKAHQEDKKPKKPETKEPKGETKPDDRETAPAIAPKKPESTETPKPPVASAPTGTPAPKAPGIRTIPAGADAFRHGQGDKRSGTGGKEKVAVDKMRDQAFREGARKRLGRLAETESDEAYRERKKKENEEAESAGRAKDDKEWSALRSAGRKAKWDDASRRKSAEQQNIFRPPNSLGIPRDQMPQIPSAHFKDFLAELERDGIEVREGEMPLGDMKPTQGEINLKSIAGGIPEGMRDRPIVLSSDDYILDGHHRWAAQSQEDKGASAKVLKIGEPIEALLKRARAFHGTTYKSIDTPVAATPKAEPAKEDAKPDGETQAASKPKWNAASARKKLGARSHEGSVPGLLDDPVPRRPMVRVARK